MGNRANVRYKMKITKRKLRRIIREACDICGSDNVSMPEISLDFTHAAEESSVDVPVPGDYDAVRDLLDRNSGLVDLALSFVMIKAGTSCEKSSAQAIIDHLQDKVSGNVVEKAAEWEADGMPGADILNLKKEYKKIIQKNLLRK